MFGKYAGIGGKHMKAVKGNKEYLIKETEINFYQDAGYDIYDDNGEIVKYGRGKSVSYEDYEAVKAELKQMKKEQLMTAEDVDVIDILKAFANEHGVDIGKTSTVAGIVKKIKEHIPESGD